MLTDLNLRNKRCLVRVDFNVPLNDAYEIMDSTRIKAALPTLKYILKQGASLVLMTHMGRPNKDDLESLRRYTTRHLLDTLSQNLGVVVTHASDFLGKDREKVLAIRAGEVIILENTRFYPEEKKGDDEFARQLASFGDIYINDAFGTAHRNHASTAVVAKFFDKNSKAFGFLIEKEIENGSKLLHDPTPPVTAIIGGAKISDKIQLIEKLMEFADNILIGGGMAYTFIKAKGGNIGTSLCQEDYLQLALSLLEKAEKTNTQIILPEDSVVADEFKNEAGNQIVLSHKIPDGWMGLDIGPRAMRSFRQYILSSKTILWNGPVGVFEMKTFADGTFYIAEIVAEATKNGAYSLIGGGDSVSAINKSGLSEQVSFISTGGGAMLEFLEGKELPGIAAIHK